MKVVACIGAVLMVVLLMIASVLDLAAKDPSAMPEDLYLQLAAYLPEYVTNTVDGIVWIVPVEYTRLTSPFGWRMHPVHKEWRYHGGLDLAAPEGTPIVATRSGSVMAAGYNSSSGNYVWIDHGDGFVTRYMHMTHYIVSNDQQVAAGEIIGYVGSTGTSTGNHLHFSVYLEGQAVDPAYYIGITEE